MKIMGSFADETYAHAVGNIIQSASNILFGQSSGTVSEKKGYLIICGRLGVIMRVDYFIYVKKITA
jgi:hypothetical protein